MTEGLSLQTIAEAGDRLRGIIHRTPIVTTHSEPWPLGAELRLKAENFQVTGSFKIRGAFNKIAVLEQGSVQGVVTASSGNHGQAVAWAARHFGLAAIVVVPKTAPQSKIHAAQSYGAEVEYCGTTSQERLERAELIAKERGYAFVPPYDDPEVMSGQGTIGLEIVEDWPEVEVVLVPIGGGGLISGIATAIKSIRPDILVIGVEAAGAAKAWTSRLRHQRIILDHTDTIADGIKTLALGVLTYPIVEQSVDHLLTVNDAAIMQAVRWLLFRHKLLAEPSGAATVAAFMTNPEWFSGRRAVALLSGGNIDPNVLRSIL